MNPTTEKLNKPDDAVVRAFEDAMAHLEAGRHVARLGKGDTTFEKVDEEKSTIYGVAVTLQGEALGHGVFLDETFIDDALGQAKQLDANGGMKIRFGHPGWMGDAIGTYLGRGHNFEKRRCKRADGTDAYGLYCDVVFSKVAELSPAGNLPAYMMALAKEAPESAGMSICFDYADYVILTKEGDRIEWKKYKQDHKADYSDYMFPTVMMWADYKALSVDGRLYALLGKLYGADFTDDPAATDGVFSAVDGIETALAAINNQRALMGQPKLALSVEGEASKRLSGMQAEKDREIAALKKQLADADEQLKKSKAESETALVEAQAKMSSQATELESARKDLVHMSKRLESVETAHATLTGAVLNPPDVAPEKPKTLSAFMQEHGNNLSRAKREDPETYKALMLRYGAKA